MNTLTNGLPANVTIALEKLQRQSVGLTAEQRKVWTAAVKLACTRSPKAVARIAGKLDPDPLASLTSDVLTTPFVAGVAEMTIANNGGKVSTSYGATVDAFLGALRPPSKALVKHSHAPSRLTTLEIDGQSIELTAGKLERIGMRAMVQSGVLRDGATVTLTYNAAQGVVYRTVNGSAVKLERAAHVLEDDSTIAYQGKEQSKEFGSLVRDAKDRGFLTWVAAKLERKRDLSSKEIERLQGMGIKLTAKGKALPDTAILETITAALETL